MQSPSCHLIRRNALWPISMTRHRLSCRLYASKSPSEVALLFGFQEEEVSLIKDAVEAVFGSTSAVVHQVSMQESRKWTIAQLIKQAKRQPPTREQIDCDSAIGLLTAKKTRRGKNHKGNDAMAGRVILLCGPSIQSVGATINATLVEQLQLAPCVVGAGGLPSQEDAMAREVVVRLRRAHSDFHNLIRPWKTQESYMTPPPNLITPLSPPPWKTQESYMTPPPNLITPLSPPPCDQLQLQAEEGGVPMPRLVVNAQLDSGYVPLSSDPLGVKGELRADAGHVVVIDDLCSDEERGKLLAFLTSPSHDHSGPPPLDKWEKSCVDRVGDQATWGLSQEMLSRLQDDPPHELVALQSRIQALYPESLCCHLPADILSAVDEDNEEEEMVGCSSFVGNAVLRDDPCQWHFDADPSSFPPSSPWVHNLGYYFNREQGKPLLVSILLYLNDEWPDSFQSETMIMDRRMQCGLFVRPKPGRVVLMDQDLLHRISAPSALASGRPRYSLVWKSVFIPKRDPLLGLDNENVQGGEATGQLQVMLSRPEWGKPMKL